MRPVANDLQLFASSRGQFEFSRFQVVFEEFHIPQSLVFKGYVPLMFKIDKNPLKLLLQRILPNNVPQKDLSYFFKLKTHKFFHHKKLFIFSSLGWLIQPP